MKLIAALFGFVLAGAAAIGAENLDRNEMVAIPAGDFMMGSNDGPDDERPAHLVTVTAF